MYVMFDILWKNVTIVLKIHQVLCKLQKVSFKSKKSVNPTLCQYFRQLLLKYTEAGHR